MERPGSILSVMVAISIAIAALLPHLSSSGDKAGTGKASDTLASLDSRLQGPDLAEETALVDLLAEHFQVSVSPAAMRQYLKKKIARHEPADTRLLAHLSAPPAGRVSVRIRHDASDSDAFVVDTSRPDPSNYKLATDRLARTIIREAADAVNVSEIRFLIATIPDPVDSVETWQFDPDLDALRQAIGANGFGLDRFRLPDMHGGMRATGSVQRGDQHRHWPGVVLFTRRTPSPSTSAPGSVQETTPQALSAGAAAGQGTEQLLVLFLVPETPTAGIHHEPFQWAATFIANWVTEEQQARSSPSRSSLIAVIGPTFSGSAPSLARALQISRPLLDQLLPPGAIPNNTIYVISGNASNASNKDIIQSAFTGRNAPNGGKSGGALKVDFHAVLHPNQVLEMAVQHFKKKRGMCGPSAILYEGSTQFGQDVGNVGNTGPSQPVANAKQSSTSIVQGSTVCPDDAPDSLLRLEVPFNIAQLRTAGSDLTRRTRTFETLLPHTRPLPMQELVHPTDQLTVSTPEMMAAYVELVLRSLIDGLRSHKVRTAILSMTDVRDRLLLAREIQQRAPDVTIFIMEGDLSISHPEQYAWTSNVFLASSYPLNTITQPSQSIKQFPNSGAQGIYNAAIAAMHLSGLGAPLVPLLDYRVPLVDYRAVTETAATIDGGPGCPITMPPVWISAITRGRAWPVAIENVCDHATFLSSDNVPFTVTDYMLAPTEQGRTLSLEKPIELSRVTRATLASLFIALLALLIASYSYIRSALSTDWLAVSVVLIPVTTAFVAWPASSIAALGVAPVILMLPTLAVGTLGLSSALAITGVTLAVFVPVSLSLGDIAGSFYGRASLMDLGSGISPLLPLLLAESLPLLLCAVVLRLRFVSCDSSMDAANSSEAWLNTVLSLKEVTVGRFENVEWLQPIQRNLFFLTPQLWAATALTLVAACCFVFESPLVPLWSAHGVTFGWSVAWAIVAVQFVLTVSLLQFWWHWRTCAELLRRLARHKVATAYRKISNHLIPRSLLPKRPRLFELQVILDSLSAAGHESYHDCLGRELAKGNARRPRWWASDTWAEIRRVIPVVAASLAVARQGRQTEKDCAFLATGAVFVVRELLARLSICLLLIGPCLAILIGLHTTASFQGRHRLLALIWIDVIAAVLIIMAAFIQMDRDETLSLVTNTVPGQLNWNFDLASKVAVYALLPLLALFASQFPGIGTSIAEAFRSIPTVP